MRHKSVHFEEVVPLLLNYQQIKKMILITRTPKKVIGLEGYNIKITKQELI